MVRGSGGVAVARPAGGAAAARGLAGHRYLLAVALLVALTSGTSLVLMAVGASVLGYPPPAGSPGSAAAAASPFLTYAPGHASNDDHGYPEPRSYGPMSGHPGCRVARALGPERCMLLRPPAGPEGTEPVIGHAVR
jgi:hypothetical protein